ncbi:hypothetical protein J0H58_16595 [bacterium]|nr:hypothetical protein [bacterium]
MNRRKWLVAALLAVPVAVGGGLAYANTTQASGYTCPVTGEELPCEKCCPLNGAKAQGSTQATDGEFVCPVTGEALACPNCCPLNKAK